MKKVFILIVKRFFVDKIRGLEFAGAIYNDEIFVFSKESQAIEARREMFNKKKFGLQFADTFDSEYFHDGSCGNYWQLRENDGCRTIYEIIEKNL